MTVYRPTFTQDGQQKRSSRWWIEFRDHREVRRRIGGLHDKAASLELERKLARLVDARKLGEQPRADVAKVIELLPAKDREKLAKWGLIDSDRIAAFKPLAAHLDDWRQALLARNNTEKHARHNYARAGRLLAGCTYWTDVNSDDVQRVLLQLRESGLGLRVLNFYLGATKQFCAWMVKTGRASESPLRHLEGYNADTDRRRERRALTPAEAAILLQAVAHSGRRGCMDGPQRALVYQVMLETGIRIGELRKLKKSDFTLTRVPSVRVRAGTSKNRKEAELPLRSDTVDLLKRHFQDRLPAAPAFTAASANTMTKAFIADLKDAGIARRDDAGRVLDLHSLRHTFATWLAQGGTHPRLMQELCRHSSVELTMKVYTHTTLTDERRAVDCLPDLSRAAESAKATGTENLGSSLGSDGVFQGQTVPQDNPKPVDSETSKQEPQTCMDSTKSAPEAGSEADDSWRWRGDSNPRMTVLQTVA